MNLIDNMTEREAKHLLNDICGVFGIGGEARTPIFIMANVKNSADDLFCRNKRVVEFLEGRTFRFIKKANGYIFTRPGKEPDFSGRSIIEAVEKAIDYEEANP